MAAGRKIRGITIEIGGDTTGLQKALKGVNEKINNTQAQLRDVNNLLKLDPSNTVLVAQKQALLTEAIENTKDKLKALEGAQQKVAEALKAGKIGQEEYMAFQREVEATKAALGRYETELSGLNTEQDRLSTNTERLNKLFKATDSTVDDYADVLGSKLVTAIKNGSASSDQLKQAIEKVGKSATDGKADIKQLADALDEVDDGEAVKNLIRELKDVGDQADETADQLEDMGKTMTGGVLMEAADQLGAVGDKINEIGEAAKDAFLETQDATTKASTYFGETGEAAEQTARVIKNVYGEGVGDSMDTVANAVIMVKKNLKDLDEVTLANITEQAITLDELYGIDMNETLRGANSLMNQFGLTAQEAMDYIVKGTQNGLDKTNELGDNLSEYAGKFAQAGYSAEEYFQLLQNGLEGGAYNLDKVNDAINEVTTRLTDGTISDSLSQIDEKTGKVEAGTGNWGQAVEDVFKQWQQGGATQKEVIDAIVEDIRNTENQQEKLNKAALAFGTMGEDGNAKFIESLTSVGKVYNDVTDAATDMFDQSTTESQTFEASMRQLHQSLVPVGEALMSLANDIIPPIASAIKAASEGFGKLPGVGKNFVIILGALISAFTALAPIILAVKAVIAGFGTAALGPVAIAIGVAAAAITGIIALIKNWGNITEWFGNVTQKIKEKCVEIWSSICSFFTDTIPKAWDALVAKFQGAASWWSEIWQQAKDYFSEIWESICSFFTDTIPQAWQSVVSWAQGIPSWWSGIWQQVKDYFVGIWTDMLDNPALSAVATTLQNLWQNCSKTVRDIWQGLVDIGTNTWEMIKNAVLGPVLLLIDLVTGNFEQLRSDAGKIWSNMRTAATRIWLSLQQVVVSLAKGLVNNTVILITGFKDELSNLWKLAKQAATQAWENLKNTVVTTAQNLKNSALQEIQNLKDTAAQTWENLKNTTAQTWENLKNAVITTATNLKSSTTQEIQNLKESTAQNWQNMKTAASETWQNIKNQVVQTAQSLKNSAIQAFQNMVSGIKSALSSVGTVVKDGFRSAISYITSLPSQAVQWGKDFIDGIVSGIRSAMGRVKSAVSDVASTIRSFLHFSVPDEGPLTEYESWMPDFMRGLAEGIEKSKSVVADAIAGVSKDMTIDANAMLDQSSARQNNAILSITSLLTQYLPYLARGLQIEWADTAGAAARLAPDMNKQLGILAIEEGFM